MTTLLDIQAQIAQLQKQAEEIKTNDFKKNLNAILSLMASTGITVKDIEGSSPKIKKTGSTESTKQAPVKYRGINGETWSGRGLQPRWLKDLIAQGKLKEEFSVASWAQKQDQTETT